MNLKVANLNFQFKCPEQIKIHRTCPGELDDVVKHLEEATGSVVVSEIGRTVILYRPSLTKLKAEEKKKQNQKIFMRRKLRAKPAFPVKKPRIRNSLFFGFLSSIFPSFFCFLKRI